MRELDNPARRTLLRRIAIGASLVSVARAGAASTHAADAASLPLLKPTDPAAQATHYAADARNAEGAQPGANCSNCSLYGKVTATEGTCSLFPSNLVAAAGWCNAWSSL